MTCSNNFVELCKLQLHDAKLKSDFPLLFGTHSRNRKTCIDTGSMNKAREVQIIFKTVQEAGKQPIRRRHWQFWLPHLSSILEGR